MIHFSGVPKTCTRNGIKERLGELDASIAFVDFKIGDQEGWVRLQGENAAKAVIDKMKDSIVSVSDVLENKFVWHYFTLILFKGINTRGRS